MSKHDSDIDRMEHEAETHRRRVEDTLGELEAKLSPGQLMDEVIRSFRQSSGPGNVRGFADNLGRSMRDNPLPVALVGVGLLWLAAGPEQKPRRGANPMGFGKSNDDGDLADYGVAGPDRAYDDTYGDEDYEYGYVDYDDDLTPSRVSAAEEAAFALDPNEGESESDLQHRRDRLRARIMRLRERSGESASDLRGRIERAIASSRSRLRAGSGRAQDTMSRILDEQPLLAAAAGVTFGAALAAMLPRTAMENQRLGPVRQRAEDEVRDRAKQGLHEADERATAAYEAGRDAATDRQTHTNGGPHA